MQDQTTFMRKALDNIFTDEFGMSISFTGRKVKNQGKIPLKTLGLYQLLCGKVLFMLYMPIINNLILGNINYFFFVS